MSPLEAARGKNIVFYDGVCVFCDNTVQVLYRIDRRRSLAFATLQGQLGRILAASPAFPPDAELLSSIVFVTEFGTGFERIYTRSDAALKILELTGGIWHAALLFRLVPRFARDAFYNWFAARRYRWFGKKNSVTCFLPPPEDRGRFFE